MTVDIKKFKRLTEREHVRLRPGRYLGDVNTAEVQGWHVNNTWQVVQGQTHTNPALLKMFDEIITNSADHSLKPEGKHLNTIRVYFNQMAGFISVFDNGGIPVVEVEDSGEKLWLPDMLFGYLRSGENFDDTADNFAAGQNGEGSTLTNIFSTRFDVETCDKVNNFFISYQDGMGSKTPPEIKPATTGATGFTRITFFPEWSLLGLTGREPWIAGMLRRRCLEIAACNLHIKVYFNDEAVAVKNFGDFAHKFDPEAVACSVPGWNVALGLSDTGFRHHSYVNSTNTFVGGTHIDHVMNKIVAEVRDHIQTKTNQTIKPAEILNQFQLFLSARINKPRYSSQTKENLITPVSRYGDTFTPPEAFIKAIINSPMMKTLLAWAQRRKMSQDAKDAQKEIDEARKASFHHIAKYRPATNKDKSQNVLFVAEGDSALKPLQAAKKTHHGLFPLRGKPVNVFDSTIKHLAEQKEFQDLIQIMGLNLTSFDPATLRYSSMILATDADHDGAHIRGLMLVAFWRFWPQLIEQGFLRFLSTPIMTAKVGKDVLEFMTKQEYYDWSEANPGVKHDVKYYKGLGSWDTKDMERFMNDEKYMVRVKPMTEQDIEKLVLAFDPSGSKERQSWLALHEEKEGETDE